VRPVVLLVTESDIGHPYKEEVQCIDSVSVSFVSNHKNIRYTVNYNK
jgi:hypothetical protein